MEILKFLLIPIIILYMLKFIACKTIHSICTESANMDMRNLGVSRNKKVLLGLVPIVV